MRRGVLVLVEGEREVSLVRAVDAPRTGLTVTRRCADVAELLAAAAAGSGQAALVDARAPGVDAALVSRVEAGGVRVLVLTEPSDAGHWPRASGVTDRAADPELVLSALVGVLGARVGAGEAAGAEASEDIAGEEGTAEPKRTAQDAPGEGRPGTKIVGSSVGGSPSSGEVSIEDLLAPPEEDDEEVGDAPEGRIVVVWGASGAPGRTTLAANLAVEVAVLLEREGGGAVGRQRRRRREGVHEEAQGRGDGRPVLLIDLDTEAPSLAQTLGMLEDSSSIAAVARRASHGRLTPTGLRTMSPRLRPGLHVATGLSRADRWRELSTAALAELWPAARRAAQVTIVDVGAGAEEPPPGLDAWGAPPRHGATRSALADADVVLVAGSADAVGVRRLVDALAQLREESLAPRAQVIPVLTKVRASAAGPNPAQACLAALDRYVKIDEAIVVPDDRAAFDECLLLGRTLLEAAPRSPAREPLTALARWLVPVGVAA